MIPNNENVLIVSVNWIGDTVMSMPAIQAFRQHHPDARITLLAKPGILPLWELHAAPDHIEPLHPGLSGVVRTSRRLRRIGPFDRAFIMPHSFRSALIPWLAGIPCRVAMPGHGRDWMVNQIVSPPMDGAHNHQAYEYMHLLVPESVNEPLPSPTLSIPPEDKEFAVTLTRELPRPLIGLVPGAARGPSKQWPQASYIAVGRQLANTYQVGIAVTGAAQEKTLCDHVAHSIGPSARAFAGQTTLRQWMALLSICDVVVANDSGAMHVAAALGSSVVAIFGITDPDKTGPLGGRCLILQKSEQRQRDVPRVSSVATAALTAIQPHEVCEAVTSLLPDSSLTGKDDK